MAKINRKLQDRKAAPNVKPSAEVIPITLPLHRAKARELISFVLEWADELRQSPSADTLAAYNLKCLDGNVTAAIETIERTLSAEQRADLDEMIAARRAGRDCNCKRCIALRPPLAPERSNVLAFRTGRAQETPQ